MWGSAGISKSGVLMNAFFQRGIPAKCPRCGHNTVTRTNRYSRKQFTGCSEWPACHFSIDGVRMKTTRKIIGEKIKYETAAGPMIGTIIGSNNYGNYIVKIDPRSPVKGFKFDPACLIEDYCEPEFCKNLKKSTFWYISTHQEVEEATESDLLPKTLKSKSTKESTLSSTAKSNFQSFEGESTMNDKKNATQIIKSDGQEAAYRVAGKRLSSGANQLLTKVLKSSLGPEHGAAVEAIMQTPAGTMLTQLALGWGLTYAPGPAQDARIQKLASEFRIQGTAEGMDIVVGGIMEHLTPLLNDALSMLPGAEAPTNARVATPAESPAVLSEEEEHGLEDISEPKRASVGK